MEKPQKQCQIKIITENPDRHEFYFFASAEVAEQMKEFGYMHDLVHQNYQQFQLEIDPRYDYEEVKAYLLSLEPTTEGETA